MVKEIRKKEIIPLIKQVSSLFYMKRNVDTG